MATKNPFDLLGDDDTEDPSLLVASLQQKMEPKKSLAASAKAPPSVDKKGTAKLPSKPLPPAQAVRESARGGRGGGRGRGTGGESYRDSNYNESSYASREVSFGQGASGEGGDVRRGGSRGAYRGGQRGGFANGRVDSYRDQARPYKNHERHSGTGRGNDIKREGAGVGNWGTPSDELAPVTEEVAAAVERNWDVEKPGEKPTTVEEPAVVTEVEEKEPEPEEMTLEEYEKVLEEKRKSLQALKTEERKVDGKEFETMKPLPSKKANEDIFAKLGSEKEKKKELVEKAKTTVSINEFLKPAEGGRYHGGGRGRGRGRNARGGNNGGNEGSYKAPYVEDQSQFPTLGGK